MMGDCLEIMKKGIKDDTVDLIVTDPPYGLSFLGSDWDKAVPSIDTWKECIRVLKPGAFAFIMSSPRMDCLGEMSRRLQEAGFKVGFTPIFWTYMTGFPKAMNIYKKLGVKDESLKGAYAGFQPKPSLEVIIVAMKPLSEKTYLEQVKRNGKGVTWLDDCRIPHAERQVPSTRKGGGGTVFNESNSGLRRYVPSFSSPDTRGRFVPNLLVTDDALNDGSVRVTSPHGGDREKLDTRERGWGFKRLPYDSSDVGSASKYFDLDRWWEKRVTSLPPSVQTTFPFLIVPKPSNRERDSGLGEGGNIHLSVKPLKLMSYLVTLGSREGDLVLDPFLGSGTTLISSCLLGRRCIGIERDEKYVDIARKRFIYYNGGRNESIDSYLTVVSQ